MPTTPQGLESAITSTEAHLKQLKESHDRALNARLTPFIIRVIYDTNSYGDYKELYPLPEWTMLRFKREVLQLFGLLHGNYTKPDKNYTFATYFGNEAFLNNSKRVKSCLGLQCVVSLCPKRAAPVPEMPVAITDNEATQADAHSSTSGSDDDNDKGHASDASLDSDDVSISEFIKLSDGYADEWTDSEGEEDEGDIMAPTIWVDVKEFQGRNVALFRGVSILITTQELKAMIEHDIARKLPSSSSEKTLGVDDFILKCNNYKMENDNEIGDYLESNNQEKLEVMLHLTLRGGAPFSVRKHHTKEEALLKLQKRVIQNVCGDSVPEYALADVPEEIQTFTRTLKEQVEQVQVLRAQGVRVIRAGLRQCNNEDLKTVTEIVSYNGGKRGNNEDRVTKSIHYLFPPMVKIEASSGHLQHVANKVTADFLKIFVSEYSVYVSSACQLSIDSFKADVQAELERRHEPHEAVSNAGGCVSM
ncbi:unnamed protein product [Effrenium voratum]|nr:unnamed protein product [Effrenium voratum]